MAPLRPSLLIALLAPCLAACDGDEIPPAPEGQPSPNASILPAPLASSRDLVSTPPTAKSGRAALTAADAATARRLGGLQPLVPTRMAVNEPLPADRLSTKDSVGLTLTARFDWTDLSSPPKLPDLSPDTLRRAREAAARVIEIDLAYAGRMRLSLASPAFPFPEATELRARADHFGHALVWPDVTRYRILAAGSVRAAFAEGRPDVTPLMRPKLTDRGAGERLGLETRTARLETNVGTVDLEQASVSGSDHSGALLCRFLMELISAEPSTPACARDWVPLTAEFVWAQGGRLHFEVTSLQNREDLPLDQISVPPVGAKFAAGRLPPQPTAVFLSPEMLGAFRARPRLPQTPGDDAPQEGLLADNQTDTLKYILVDGVPVAWVRPKHERNVTGLKAGQYSIGWRDFLGMDVTSAEVVQLPARVSIGSRPEDAGGRTN